MKISLSILIIAVMWLLNPIILLAQDKVTLTLKKQAEFKGGQEAMINFLSNNFKYPKKAKKNKTEGIVLVGFVVDSDGTIRDTKVLKNLSPECDAEALRLVNLMKGKWNPALDTNNTAILMPFTLPIKFKIN